VVQHGSEVLICTGLVNQIYLKGGKTMQAIYLTINQSHQMASDTEQVSIDLSIVFPYERTSVGANCH
jgi:hypothetical protein